MPGLDRYARALAVLEEHLAIRARGGSESAEDLLARHAELREMLEPMLAASRDGLGETTPLPPGAPPWRGLPAEGEHVGGYRILRLLGQGGMGVVFLAEDERLRRRVALKLLRPERVGLGEARDRFWREAKLAARVEHPGICQVYEVGEADELPFFAMRYVEGESLAARLARRRAQGTPLTRTETDEYVAIAERVARALHHAHEHGVVHRDVKPGNILLEPDGTPVVLDFGMARGADDLALTMTGEHVGTPLYMSPEQVAPTARGIDRRADVYALGATLYEAVAGAPPFRGTTMRDLFDAILRREPPRAGAGNPHAAGDLEVVIAKAMDKDRERRYRTAAEFADDLARVLQRLPVHARPLGPLLRARRWVARNPLPAALLAVVVTALAVISAFFLEARRARADYDLMALSVRVRKLHERERGLYAEWPDHAGALRRWLAEARQLAAQAPEVEAALARVTPAAESGDETATFARDTLGSTLAELRALGTAEGLVTRVQRHLALAERERRETVEAHAAAWSEAIAAIAASERYGGLRLTPQVGLVPIGVDPASGLWEFGHPASGEVPVPVDGRIAVTPGTGIVFVLLPGGTFRMGAQARDKAAKDYDEGARTEESKPHDVPLDPFLLAKHELTQKQWMRLDDGSNPSVSHPDAGFRVPITFAHPVEMVSWDDAESVLARYGLLLPTEAQWEYACRAGTTTPWWTGTEKASLSGRVNLADASAHAEGAKWSGLDRDLNDGFPWHAPVDALAANPFGLHHIAGNVFEWCRDTYVKYDTAPRPKDGLRSTAPGDRIARGGAFDHAPVHARSALRRRIDPASHANNVGVRAARPILP